MQGDLIRRSAALEKMGKLPLCWEYGQAVAECWGIVNDLPAVDAVPVVRCKDCEYTDTEVGLPNGALYCNEWGSVVRSHWYCCRGARMDGDENAAD